MIKIKLYICVFASVWFFSACADSFLDISPKDELTEAAFFKIESDMEMALVSVYSRFYRQTHTVMYNPIRWDDHTHSAGGMDQVHRRAKQHFDLSFAPDRKDLYGSYWRDGYILIFRANMLIQKLGEMDIDWTDPGRKNEMEAEVRFIRAATYFTLARYFNRVPLLTKPTSENLPQAEPEEMYSFIADDLLFAEQYAPEVITSRAKITTWAVKSMMARVFLFYTGTYEKPDVEGKITQAMALQGLEEVIGSGHFGLLPEFKDLFITPAATLNEAGDAYVTSYAGKDNIEVVLSHRHNMLPTDVSNNSVAQLGMRTKPYPPYAYGFGGNTVKPEFVNKFEEGDPRKEASIIDFFGEGYGDDLDISQYRDFTGYQTKKYAPLCDPDGINHVTKAGGNWNAFPYDYMRIRYADVLLMAAELGSSNAQQYFNMVRDRVGMPHKPVTLENIHLEREFELAFEGFRYWDLRRQGIDVLADALTYEGTVLDGGAPYTHRIDGDNVRNKNGFMQIPENQIILSDGVLVQNPGW